MKKTRLLRAGAALFISLMLMLSLVSCGAFIKGDEAKATVEEFVAALSSDDYEKITELSHPVLIRAAEQQGETLESFFGGIESSTDLDFSSGTYVKKYNGFNTRIDNGNATYVLSALLVVGKYEVQSEIAVGRSDEGYGITYFYFENGPYDEVEE